MDNLFDLEDFEDNNDIQNQPVTNIKSTINGKGEIQEKYL
jgi:hypothetical protein